MPSTCFWIARNLRMKRSSKSRSNGLSTFPPIRSRYSWVNLLSKLMLNPGDYAKSKFNCRRWRMKPKSIWIICPSKSIKIFALWRSLTCNRYVINGKTPNEVVHRFVEQRRIRFTKMEREILAERHEIATATKARGGRWGGCWRDIRISGVGSIPAAYATSQEKFLNTIHTCSAF